AGSIGRLRGGTSPTSWRYADSGCGWPVGCSRSAWSADGVVGLWPHRAGPARPALALGVKDDPARALRTPSLGEGLPAQRGRVPTGLEVHRLGVLRTLLLPGV